MPEWRGRRGLVCTVEVVGGGDELASQAMLGKGGEKEGGRVRGGGGRER